MAPVPDRVKKIVDLYIKKLRENNIPISQAILFGSFAQGTAGKWSDIDLAIVSEIFEGDRFADRGKLRRIKLSVSNDLEILPFRPQDFTEDDPLVKEILDTGIRIV